LRFALGFERTAVFRDLEGFARALRGLLLRRAFAAFRFGFALGWCLDLPGWSTLTGTFGDHDPSAQTPDAVPVAVVPL
jgi:hypothetical protein